MQIHFIQRKQFNETDVTSHAFQQISSLKFFSEWYRRPLKMLWPATRSPWACSWTTLAESNYAYAAFFTHCVACYICKLVEIYTRRISDFWVSKCKAVFALASFHNLPVQFFKPAWCFNLKWSDTVVVNLQVYFHFLKGYCELSCFFSATDVQTVDYF